ncbi:uncharacterized protein METZ01_LOCUS165114, partial [marine metagenome]
VSQLLSQLDLHPERERRILVYSRVCTLISREVTEVPFYACGTQPQPDPQPRKSLVPSEPVKGTGALISFVTGVSAGVSPFPTPACSTRSPQVSTCSFILWRISSVQPFVSQWYS